MAKQLAIFAGGCFWCTEAVFEQVQGVEKVISGYTGGSVPGHPTYREICSGLTGHAEAVQILFENTSISYEELLVIFMTTHDPTTLNKQGADVGTQYRSAIFYTNKQQKEIASEIIKTIQVYYNEPIVTTLEELGVFYPAEEVHQNYYKNNKGQPYCNFVITPKLTKLRKLFADKLKKE